MNANTTPRRHWGTIALLALVGGIGCAAAAAGAAGAGTGIYLTTRGAKAIVNGSVSDVTTRSREVLERRGVEVDAASTEDKGAQQELKGKQGDLDVTVSLEKETSTTTRAEVSARKNLVEWDKDYAKELLNEIVQGSGARAAVDTTMVDRTARDTVHIIGPDTTTVPRDTMPRDSMPKDTVP
jgi:hypothetical protein